MYRTWLGVGLLVFLLIFGLVVSTVLNRVQSPICVLLDAASQSVLSGDAREGYRIARHARQQWEQHWRFTAVFSGHAPMDEIDGLFGQLSAYAQEDRPLDFSACCHRISVLIDAVQEAHLLNWWNLL